MSTKRTLLAALAVVVIAGSVLWLATRTVRSIGGRWAVDAGLPPLEPWTPALGLRRTFDTLPQPPPPPPRVRLLEGNEEAWIERWRILTVARERVDAGSFIVRNDVYGLAFLGHLLHLRGRGVAVRLLIDAYGTSMARSVFAEDYLDELVAAGVEMRTYRPMLGRVVEAALRLEPLAAVASEHDKVLLVDGKHAVLGGRNVGGEYFASPERHPEAFLDVDVLVAGASACTALERAFEAEWSSGVAPALGERIDVASRRAELLGAHRAMDAWLRGAAGELDGDDAAAPHLRVLREEHPNLEGALARRRSEALVRHEVRILDSVPRLGHGQDDVTRGLARLLASAEREVLIQSPYLVLAGGAVERFVEAGRRGVAITVVTNGPTSSDNALSQALFLEQWPELLARVPGMRLFVRGDRHNVHGKTAVFDGQVAVVGTYNLDPISMAVNGEVVLVVWSKEFAARVAAPLHAAIDEGSPTTFEYRIVRDAAGVPVRGDDGRPQVAFGPGQHVEPSRWSAVHTWSTVVRIVRLLAPSQPLFWASRPPPTERAVARSAVDADEAAH
ncbi:MAG: phospholipase D-like domain-containing protein [Thermodesulfobacteriota bacterium]